MVIDQEAQNVLLDAEVVGHDLVAALAGLRTGFAHLLGPGRAGKVDGGFIPGVRLLAGNASGKLLSRHAGKLAGFEDELLGGSAVGRDDAAQCADLANVENEGTRVYV